MSKAALETAGLTKFYGKTRGIEDLDLRVAQGEVFGFLGPERRREDDDHPSSARPDPTTRGSARIARHDTRTDSLDGRRLIGPAPLSF